MTWIIGLLTGNPIARLLGKVLGIALAVLTFGAWQRRQGAQGQKAKQAEARTKTIQKAEEVEDAVDAKTDAAVRGDLGRWVRPD
jgi:flagellar biosynthesis component FlhA